MEHNKLILIYYATFADEVDSCSGTLVQCQITMATKLIWPITDHGMYGGMKAIKHKIYCKHLKSSWEGFVGNV